MRGTHSHIWQRILFGLGLLGLGIWQAPRLIYSLMGESEQEQSAQDIDQPITAMILQTIESHGAEVLVREDNNGIINGIFRVEDPQKIGDVLKQRAKEQEIELYATPVDGLDVEIRAYSGPTLALQVLLVPILPVVQEAPRAPTLRERPLIALIISGLGEQDAPHITDATFPLTVAVRPYAPFSLRVAERAALNWHEVLVDLMEVDPLLRDRPSISEAITAIPFASGIVDENAPHSGLPEPMIMVQPSSGQSYPRSLVGRWLPAQRSERRTVTAALNRAKHIATSRGGGAVIIDINDPALPEILSWAAEEEGYRMALASEVLRADDVRGLVPLP